MKGARDAFQNVWHLDSVGTDATGVRRHVKADATTQTLFGNARTISGGNIRM